MRVLNRKLVRTLWSSKGQALAVTAVILVGVASLVSTLSAYRSLKVTRDAYYREYRFADFWVPLERAPRRAALAVEALPGVRRAEGRIVEDVNLDVEGKPEACTGRIISLPETRGIAINDIHLVTGRYFSKEVMNEVIVSDRFARENRLAVGDSVWATMNDRKQALRIIGTALSPEYVYQIRNAREFLPNSDRFAILWVKEDYAEMALGMREAVNEIVGFLQPDADAEAVLDRVEDALDPYGVFTSILRKDQLSNRYISDEIEGQGIGARIMPAIFLGIAAMILLVMLDRIVQQERIQIGVLKAYGYSNLMIGAHYVAFALVLSVAGAVLGVLVGQWMAWLLMRMYVDFFAFPILRHRFYPDVLALSLVISVAAGVLGALWAVVRVVRIDPAQAMRPATPRAGHRILLERFGALWRRVSFIGKMVCRNIFRYKVRAGVTVFGVLCATAILLVGYFGGDCMRALIEHEFTVSQKQDVRVEFRTERGRAALLEAARFPHTRLAEPELNYPFTIRAGWREKDVLVTGLAPDAHLLDLRTTAGRRVSVGEAGLVLPDYLARTLRVRPGDVVVLDPLLGKVDRPAAVTVRAVVRQYMGTSAYMNIGALSRILDEPFALNAVRLTVARGRQRALHRYLKDVPGVAGVEVKADAQRKVEETLAASMAISNVIMSIFAGVIAFAIIYNATAISVTQRRRELASLRVLGFTLGEVRRIVLGENLLLSGLGVALGLPVGVLLCRVIIGAYETDVYRLPFVLSLRTFVWTGLSLVAFVSIANLASRRRIARLDLVEVLKARE